MTIDSKSEVSLIISVSEPTLSNTGVPCAPCILNAAKKAQSDKPSLRVQAALDQYLNFARTYRIVFQDKYDYENLPADYGLKHKLPTPGEFSRRNIPTWFVGDSGKRQRIFTNMYEGAAVVEVTMPGPYTPVCSSMHFPSLLNTETLTSLKTAGVDVIVIVVPGVIDAANAWAREQLAKNGLAYLMPNQLPVDDLDYRLELDPTMPRIMIQADPGLENIHERGLLRVVPGLGFAAERSYLLYGKQGNLLEFVKAEDPSAEKCSAVMGNAILAAAQKHSAEIELVPPSPAHKPSWWF